MRKRAVKTWGHGGTGARKVRDCLGPCGPVLALILSDSGTNCRFLSRGVTVFDLRFCSYSIQFCSATMTTHYMPGGVLRNKRGKDKLSPALLLKSSSSCREVWRTT